MCMMLIVMFGVCSEADRMSEIEIYTRLMYYSLAIGGLFGLVLLEYVRAWIKKVRA